MAPQRDVVVPVCDRSAVVESLEYSACSWLTYFCFLAECSRQPRAETTQASRSPASLQQERQDKQSTQPQTKHDREQRRTTESGSTGGTLRNSSTIADKRNKLL
eukprot:6274613-Prymnesium_polylepis.2